MAESSLPFFSQYQKKGGTQYIFTPSPNQSATTSWEPPHHNTENGKHSSTHEHTHQTHMDGKDSCGSALPSHHFTHKTKILVF